MDEFTFWGLTGGTLIGLVVLIWLLPQIITAYIMHSKGYSGCLWFIIAFFLSWVAIIVALCMPNIKRQEEQHMETIAAITSQNRSQTVIVNNQKTEDNMKRCPYCGEEIKIDAKKCKHCGEWLNKGLDAGERTPPNVNSTGRNTLDYSGSHVQSPRTNIFKKIAQSKYMWIVVVIWGLLAIISQLVEDESFELETAEDVIAVLFALGIWIFLYAILWNRLKYIGSSLWWMIVPVLFDFIFPAMEIGNSGLISRILIFGYFISTLYKPNGWWGSKVKKQIQK
jgi:hypothetical protein